ncbi:MAG: hypothetical protein GYA17_11385 [Chloroflexi bacterium]|nr:CAP domain-containing protein [Anaerolineaceae bacterium]NMB88955.1 hypothetical protein [Chloroflexota bacterium]
MNKKYALLLLPLLILLTGLACNAPIKITWKTPQAAARLETASYETVTALAGSLTPFTPTQGSPTPTLPTSSATPAASPTLTVTSDPAYSATPTHTPNPQASPTPSLTPQRTNTTVPHVLVFTLTPTRTRTNPPAAPTWTASPRPPTATNVPIVVVPTNTNAPAPTAVPPTSTAVTVPTSVPVSCSPIGDTAFEAELLSLINQQRTAQGIPQLSMQGQLTAAARNHSNDMACNSIFDHTGSDGSTPFTRISAQGYSYSAAAENLYAGSGSYNTAQAAFSAWMGSTGHRDNMLNAAYTEVGIGYSFYANSTYGAYVTADFGHP